jgi:hypothetical protein
MKSLLPESGQPVARFGGRVLECGTHVLELAAMLKTLLLLAAFNGLSLAQAAPPPFMLPSLPANVTQKLVTPASANCAVSFL